MPEHRPYAATSIARTMNARLERTHAKQAIAIFAGAPGIGKTTAIDAFAETKPGGVVIIKVQKRNAGENLVMRHVVEGLLNLLYGSAGGGHVYSSPFQVREQLKRLLDQVESQNYGSPGLTLVFDEAQNLSRAAIEALRFWNDRDRCYGSHPIGLVFVGNTEFALAASAGGESTISAAVASRALYQVELDCDDLTNNDYALVLEAHGIIDPAIRASILLKLVRPNAARDLRSLVRLIENLRDEARDSPITLATVEALLF